MVAKEADLEQLFKATSKVLSEYDDKTEEMLQTLWFTRDEQVFY